MQPIFDRACAGCHEAGAPVPFVTDDYAQVEAWAPVIKASVESRSMPPYGIDNSGDCQSFVDLPWLTEEEIETISAWVDAGAPEGEPTSRAEPAEPGQLVGTVLSAKMAQPYAPQGGDTPGSDEYRCIPLTPGLGQGRYVTGFEVIPGNTDLVHHVVIHAVDPNAMAGALTNAEQIAMLEAEDGRPGWDCFFGGGVSGTLAAIWTPGAGIVEYPADMGLEIPPDAILVAEMHYFQPDGTKVDQTEIRVSVADAVPRVGALVLADDFFMSGAELPPGQEDVPVSWSADLESLLFDGPGIRGLSSVPDSVDIYGIFAHMHELGATERVVIERAGEEVCVGDVPRYDFDWQRLYFYEDPVTMRADDIMHVACSFDTRPRTGPTSAGPQTEDEMCSVGLFIELPPTSGDPPPGSSAGSCKSCGAVVGPDAEPGRHDIGGLCDAERDLYLTLAACVCEVACADACAASFCCEDCDDQSADEACVECLLAGCAAEGEACLDGAG